MEGNRDRRGPVWLWKSWLQRNPGLTLQMLIWLWATPGASHVSSNPLPGWTLVSDRPPCLTDIHPPSCVHYTRTSYCSLTALSLTQTVLGSVTNSNVNTDRDKTGTDTTTWQHRAHSGAGGREDQASGETVTELVSCQVSKLGQKPRTSATVHEGWHGTAAWQRVRGAAWVGFPAGPEKASSCGRCGGRVAVVLSVAMSGQALPILLALLRWECPGVRGATPRHRPQYHTVQRKERLWGQSAVSFWSSLLKENKISPRRRAANFWSSHLAKTGWQPTLGLASTQWQVHVRLACPAVSPCWLLGRIRWCLPWSPTTQAGCELKKWPGVLLSRGLKMRQDLPWVQFPPCHFSAPLGLGPGCTEQLPRPHPDQLHPSLQGLGSRPLWLCFLTSQWIQMHSKGWGPVL